ncbi:MAG: glycosyltransferase [Lachnospiraceae bacterium]|nr:glycosyltransferase [Lachnospiraceae bacterium]
MSECSKQKPLISVIVPVYKVEKYLNRCVESLRKQTYNNLEIILVDDGSPDSCPMMCDGYAQEDERIKVIHQSNSGLSGARNSGLEIATGDYIGFVDSDDYVSDKMYEMLLTEMMKRDADIAICRYTRFSGELAASDDEQSISNIKEMKKMDALDNLYGADGEVYTVAWNKLYRRTVLADIRYPVGKINEDEFTTYKIMCNASKVILLEKALYYYFYNENSITTNENYLANRDIYEAYEARLNFFQQRGIEGLEQKNAKLYLDRIIERNKKLRKISKEKSKELLAFYRMKYLDFGKTVPGVGYLVYYISPALYYTIVNMKER